MPGVKDGPRNLKQMGAGRGAGGGGSRTVRRPLTKSEARQNKSAETYKTKSSTISDKAAKARAATSARMKLQASRARLFKRSVSAAGGAGAGVGFIVGQETQNRASNAKQRQARQEEIARRNRMQASRSKKK